MKKPKLKYRIVEITEGNTNYFIIQKKYWWGWDDYVENISSETPQFATEYEAEIYIHKLTNQKKKIVKEYDKYGNEIEKDVAHKIK